MIWASLLLSLLTALSPQTNDRRTRIQRKPLPPPQYFQQIKDRQDAGNKVRIVLNSGATIAIEEHGMYPLVSIVTLVQSGTEDEQAQEKGYSAVLAGFLSSRAGFAKGIYRASGEAQVTVKSRQTWFSSIGPAESLQKMIELHAALLQLPEEIKDEDLRQEKSLAEQSPQRGADVGPGGASTDRRTVSDVTQAGLRKFHARLYRPSRVTLVLSGALTREQVLERIIANWGKGKADVFRRAGTTPAESGGGFAYQLLRRPVTQARVLYVYRVPGRDHPDYWPLQILSHALTGSEEQSLAGSSESGQAVLSEARLETDERGSRLVLEVVPAEDKVEAAEVAALARVQILNTEGLATEDVERLKAQALADFYDQTEDLRSRAIALAEEEITGSALDFGKTPARIEAVTADKLQQVAAKYLIENNLSVTEIFPESAPERTFTPQAFLETLKILLPPAVTKLKEKSILPAPTRDDRREREQVSRFVPRYRPKQVRHTSVMRGPTVFYEEDHSAPLVHLGFYFVGGRDAENAENAGITDVMLRGVLLQAIKQKGAATWADLERTGARLRIVNEPDFFGVQTRVLSPYLEDVFRMLVGWLRQAAIDEGSFQLARLQVKSNQGRDPLAGPLSELWKDKSYGRPGYGSAETVGSLTLDGVQVWIKGQMAEKHPIIVIRGDFEGSSFLQGFVSTLSDRHYKSPLGQGQPGAEEKEEKEKEEETFGKVKAGENFLFKGPGQSTRNGRVLRIVEGLLDGAGGELAEDLWIKTGLAFPVSFAAIDGRNGSTLVASIHSLQGQEKTAEQALFGVFGRIQAQGLRQDIFLAGLSRAITRHYIQQMEGENDVFQTALGVISGIEADQEQAMLSGLKEIEVEDIKAFAEDYLVGPSGGTK